MGILLAEGANPAFGLIHLLSFNRRQSVGGRFASRFAVADVGNVLSDADYIVGNVSCVCSCTGCESVSEPDLVADLLQDCKNAGVSQGVGRRSFGGDMRQLYHTRPLGSNGNEAMRLQQFLPS